MQRLYELEPPCFERGDGRSDRATLIEIAMFEGRSLGAKKSLYKAIVKNPGEAPGIGDGDAVIVLHELPPESRSFLDGLPASESGVGFRIDVQASGPGFRLLMPR